MNGFINYRVIIYYNYHCNERYNYNQEVYVDKSKKNGITHYLASIKMFIENMDYEKEYTPTIYFDEYIGINFNRHLASCVVK